MTAGKATKKIAPVETVAAEEVTKKELEVTKPQDYFKQTVNTRLLELPSGFVFLVRTINLMNLTACGYLPLQLLSSLDKFKDAFNAEKIKTGDIDLTGENTKAIEDSNTIFKAVAIKAVVEPKLKEGNSTEDEIGVDDIDFMDLAEIFTKCTTGGAISFATFRK